MENNDHKNSLPLCGAVTRQLGLIIAPGSPLLNGPVQNNICIYFIVYENSIGIENSINHWSVQPLPAHSELISINHNGFPVPVCLQTALVFNED